MCSGAKRARDVYSAYVCPLVGRMTKHLTMLCSAASQRSNSASLAYPSAAAVPDPQPAEGSVTCGQCVP